MLMSFTGPRSFCTLNLVPTHIPLSSSRCSEHNEGIRPTGCTARWNLVAQSVAILEGF